MPSDLGPHRPRKVVFASVPRSGNSWLRQLLELATGRATETVFRERYTTPVITEEQGHMVAGDKTYVEAQFSERTTAYGDNCGRIDDCARVRRSQDRYAVWGL